MLNIAKEISKTSTVNVNEFHNNMTFGYHAKEGGQERKKAAFKRLCYRKSMGFGKFGSVNEVEKAKADKEIEIMNNLTSLNQDNVIKLYEIIKDETSSWLVLEFCDLGDLNEYVKQNPPDKTTKLQLMKGCSQALKVLHCLCNPSVIHNNVQPSKFLLHKREEEIIIKLASFSGNGPTAPHPFLALELYDNPDCSSTASDVFSLGLIFMALLQYSDGELVPIIGKHYQNKSFREQIMDSASYETSLHVVFDLIDESEKVTELLDGMLQLDPEDRIDISCVIQGLQEVLKQSTPGTCQCQKPATYYKYGEDISKDKANRKRVTRLKRLISHWKYHCNQEPEETKINDMTVIKLPLQFTYCNEDTHIRKCRIGPELDGKPHKTVILVGATGCGKTTTINAMVNFIYGVQLEDSYRIQMTDTPEGQLKSSCESQTDWITAYTIGASEYTSLDYTITLVDMPGFDDTRGIEYDKHLISNIQQFFSTDTKCGISSIDAVCILAKADDARLTPAQVYIFENVMSLFGDNVRENVQVLVTFAGNGTPEVVQALKNIGVPFEKYFKLNNSSLYTNHENDENHHFVELFWKMANQSYAEFFMQLNELSPNNLAESQQVLEERQQINQQLRIIYPDILHCNMLQSQIAELENKLKTQVQLSEENKNYFKSKMVTTREKVKTKEDEYETFCMTCQSTCHEQCPNTGGNIQECAVFSNGKCQVCPNKCPVTYHVSNDFVYKDVQKTVEICDETIKATYFKAVKRIVKGEQLLKERRKTIAALQSKVNETVSKITGTLKTLQDIALLKCPHVSEIKYLDFLIENERVQCDKESRGKLGTLKEMKHMAEIFYKIVHNESVLINIS